MFICCEEIISASWLRRKKYENQKIWINVPENPNARSLYKKNKVESLQKALGLPADKLFKEERVDFWWLDGFIERKKRISVLVQEVQTM